MSTTFNLSVGETLLLRTIGNRYTSNEVFNVINEKDTVNPNYLIVKMRDSICREFTSNLCDKGIFTCVDKDKDLYSLTVFGVSCYEAIMTKVVAGRARCASGRSYDGRGNDRAAQETRAETTE